MSKIIKNVSFNDFYKKYKSKYDKGEILVYSQKEIDEFNKNYSTYDFEGKTRRLDKNKQLIFNKRCKYYHIGQKYYRIPPKFTKKNITVLSLIGAIVVAGGLTGGHFIYKIVRPVNTSFIGDKEVEEKTEIVVEKETHAGSEYNATIKLKDNEIQKNEKLLPMVLEKVTTGGVELPSWSKQTAVNSNTSNKTVSFTNGAKYENNSEEPENYYTYTTNESRTVGNLYIKKVLGDVVIGYGLSSTKGITIAQQPDKVIYFVNDKFDLTGLKVKKITMSGETKDIEDTSNITTDIANGYQFTTSDIASNKKVNVCYDNCLTSFNISVREDKPESIEIIQSANQTSFLVSEKFNTDGLKIKATYTTGKTEEITDYTTSVSTNYAFTKDDVSEEKEIVISYAGCTASYNIKVAAPKEMLITSLPTKITYNVGETFSLDGLKMKVSIKDEGKFATMDVTNKTYKISDDSDIQEGYVFKAEDLGKVKKVVIESKDDSALKSNFFVSYPKECDNQADFNAFLNTNNYRAIKLIGKEDYYKFQLNGTTSDLKNVMLIGETSSNGYTPKLGALKASPTDYNLDECFANLNIMLSNLTVDSVYYINQKYVPVTNFSERINIECGFHNYESAIYDNIEFLNMFTFWGKGGSESEASGVSSSAKNYFYNCIFHAPKEDQPTVGISGEHYAMYSVTGGLFEYNNCVFDAYNRCCNFNDWAWGLYTVTLNDCTMKNVQDPVMQAGDNLMINIKDNPSSGGAPLILNLNNCTYTTYTQQGFDLFRAKDSQQTSRTKVFFDGKLKWEKGHAI